MSRMRTILFAAMFLVAGCSGGLTEQPPGTLEATVVLLGFAASVTLMLTLFARFGFVRLLGLGHTPWLFTVSWLAMRLSEGGIGGPFYYWLLSVVVLDALSLVIDAVDVVRYWKGERQATVNLDA